MVISRLFGGLGNQLFQYAAGYSLARRTDSPFKIHFEVIEDYQREYRLDFFTISAKPARAQEVELLKGGRPSLYRIIWRRLQAFLPYSNKTYIQYYKPRYYPGFEALTGNVYLSGYWQSEKYFQPYTDPVRKEFEFKHPPEENSLPILEQINSSNSVSLHIRRGDYLTTTGTRRLFTNISLDYYHRAVKMIRERVENAQFFIFSDDIPWAKANLYLDSQPTFVDIPSVQRDIEDLRLMSECQHHIITNSTFSWWGAWLGKNNQKVVIMPQKWFHSQDIDAGLIPAGWSGI